jgi:CRISP-associated protein Cas1
VTRRIAQLAALAEQAEQAEEAATLLGIEGTAARLYFDVFPSLLTGADGLPGPSFSGLRNRRPPTDAVNCLLSFCYGLLTKELLAACLTVGFDPYIGLYHRPRFGRPALALDLAEEFRPLLADSTMLTLVNNREISASDFVVRAGAVNLTADGAESGDPGMGATDEDGSPAPDVRVFGQLPPGCRVAGPHPGCPPDG